MSRRDFLLGFGKGPDKDKRKKGEDKNARPGLDLKLDGDLQVIRVRYASYRERARKQLADIQRTMQDSVEA